MSICNVIPTPPFTISHTPIPTPCAYPLLLATGKTSISPTNWFIYFGVEVVIRCEFFTNPQFCRERGQFRGENAQGSSQWKGEMCFIQALLNSAMKLVREII